MRRHLRRRKALQLARKRHCIECFTLISDYIGLDRGRQRHGARQAKLDDLKRISFVHPTWSPDLARPASGPFAPTQLIMMNEIGRIDSFRIITS